MQAVHIWDCHPEEFESLERLELTPNWVANPEEYDTLEFEDGERVPKIKDWAKGEFENLIVDAPVAKSEEAVAIEQKRQFARERNKSPLTQDQINWRLNHFREQFRLAEQAMDGVLIP